jgi:hypothetical protein
MTERASQIQRFGGDGDETPAFGGAVHEIASRAFAGNEWVWRKRMPAGFANVLEAGCKVAIGTRLKRARMHWTVSAANAIIALRCAKLSGRFEDLWERRSRKVEAAA